MNSLPVILPPRNHLRAITHRDCLNARKLCTRRVLCTASPISPASDSIKPAHQSSTGRAEQIIHSLESEIEQMFTKGVITESRYAQDFRFSDPIVQLQGRAAFAQNLRLLTNIFDIEHVVHSSAQGDWPEEVVTRWTFSARLKAFPWQQNIIFTGRSYYTISGGGQLQSQRDVWDAVANNNFLSMEGVLHVMSMALSPMQTPDLDTPKYQVLQKNRDYEVRQYSQFLTAEIPMPSGSSPASGSGFNDLAGYIFGGNNEKQKMEMTTPVFTTAGQASREGKMAFVMEAKLGNNPDKFPTPRDSRMQVVSEGNKTMAALSFSGFPLDSEVVEAERRLRGALLVDGLSPGDGYTLARYNDPFTLPFLRRNEILIDLKDFKLQ